METVRKTDSEIGTNDKPPYISIQMPRSQVSSTRLNNKDPSSFQESAESNKKIRVGIKEKNEDGRRTYRPKRWGNYNKDEDNSPKNLMMKIIKLRLRNSDS